MSFELKVKDHFIKICSNNVNNSFSSLNYKLKIRKGQYEEIYSFDIHEHCIRHFWSRRYNNFTNENSEKHIYMYGETTHPYACYHIFKAIRA